MAILLSFCILSLTMWCSSTIPISIQEASWEAGKEKKVILHTLDSVYELQKSKFKYLTLEGELKQKQRNYNNSVDMYANIFINPDSTEYVVIDNKSIVEITEKTTKFPTKTFLIILFSGAAVALGFFIIAFSQMDLNFNMN